MKSFEQWDIDEVEIQFGLVRKHSLPALEEWLAAEVQMSSFEMELLEPLREKLRLYVEDWNEDELKFKFIAPLLGLVNFDMEAVNIHAFTQRALSGTVAGISVGGRVDFIVARGKSKPMQPYFFLHEYKKERGSDNNPRAQLLVEMLVAKEHNHIEYPLYGCYVVGRNWFFVVLEGNEYALSDAFVATQEDIFTIVAILKQTKIFIAEIAALNNGHSSNTE
jgi:hypothetical protein